MSRVIVTGVDGSDTAAHASETAAKLAIALGCELQVVCAYERSEVERLRMAGDEYVFSTQASAKTVADGAVRSLVAQYPDLAITGVAAAGKPADVLVAAAESAEAEMIVVGNKRVQGFVRILGSIASEVAQKASCDVHIAYTFQR